MNWESDPDGRPARNRNGNGNTKLISGEKVWLSVREDSREPAQIEAKSLLSRSISLGEDTPDDPRVIAALEAYLEDLEAGRPLSRDEFLARHAEIAEPLSQCLAGLEFVHAGAAHRGQAAGHPCDDNLSRLDTHADDRPLARATARYA